MYKIVLYVSLFYASYYLIGELKNSKKKRIYLEREKSVLLRGKRVLTDRGENKSNVKSSLFTQLYSFYPSVCLLLRNSKFRNVNYPFQFLNSLKIKYSKICILCVFCLYNWYIYITKWNMLGIWFFSYNKQKVWRLSVLNEFLFLLILVHFGDVIK